MRKEFPTRVKVEVVKRATRNDVVYCEGCGLPCKKHRIDHIRADGLGGSNTIDNAQLLGPCCYEEKDANDGRVIAKAKRHEARHLGIKKKVRSPMPCGKGSKWKRKMTSEIVPR